MIVDFAGAPTIQLTWTEFKNVVAAKGLSIQYQDDGSTITIFAFDGPVIQFCFIYDGDVPYYIIQAGYSQAQNDLDKTDFTNNFRDSANANLKLSVSVDGAKPVTLGTPQLINTSGNTVLFTPPSGKRIRLKWLAMTSPDTNSSTVIVTIVLSGTSLYIWPLGVPGIFSHNSVREGDVDGTLVANLNISGQNVYINMDLEVF